jgi:hypothetical protein
MFEFHKLSQYEKAKTINSEGILVDFYTDDNKIISIYYLKGVFVEAIVDEKGEFEYIPFKRGYRPNKEYLVQSKRKKMAA